MKQVDKMDAASRDSNDKEIKEDNIIALTTVITIMSICYGTTE